MLDGAATSGIAIVAGAAPLEALRLGLAMTALQASIGSVNDVVDAPDDARSKPEKPIPRGDVTIGQGRAMALIAAAVGLGLSASTSWTLAAVAIAILGVGYAYDLFAKGTAWSWVPFAIGIPFLPAFAWLGATGSLPDAFAVLIPIAVLAGAALAIANATADLERDRAAGVGSIAVRLGPARAWAVHAKLILVVVAAAFASLALRGSTVWSIGATMAAGALILLAVYVGRRGSPRRRERAWEVEAIGVAVLAAAWLAGWGDLR